MHHLSPINRSAGLLLCSVLMPSLLMAQHSSLSGMSLLFWYLYLMILAPFGLYLLFANIGAATQYTAWPTFSMILSWTLAMFHLYTFSIFGSSKPLYTIIAVILFLSTIHLTYRRVVQEAPPIEEE